MKTNDFTSGLTSKQLNETMFKRFGAKINLESYDREELEKYRNLLRTKVHQAESSAKFNDLLSDDAHQKDKHMLELLNTRIKEMLGEGAKVDRQAKHITKSMMKKGKSKKDAEGIAWAHIKHPKESAETGIKETKMKKTNEAKKGDGNLANNAKPFNKVTQGDVVAGRLGKDAKGGKKVKESFPTVAGARAQAEKEKGTGKFDKKKTSTGTQYTRKSNTFDNGTEDKPVTKKKKTVNEQVFRLHVRLVNESLRYLINEDEEGKAKAITAASDMVNDFTTWMQRVGQYQTKSMIELADSIRAEFGQEEAEAFKAAVAPALAATLEVMTAERESISHAVAVLAGEATDAAAMGTDPAMAGGIPGDGMPGELPMDAGDDSMNPDMGGEEDEFGASDAAAGGAETAGRMTRESRQRERVRKIVESHSIMSKLSR